MRSRSSESLRRAKEAPDYLVNQENGALLNTNRLALVAYKKKRQHNRRMAGMADRVEQLEKDMGDIKALLQILVERSQ
jgi:hypothetical protein